MAEINWGALQSPDFAGNALRYRRAGEEDGRAIATRNALKSYGTNPDGAIQDLMGVDPDAALELKARQQKDQDRQARIAGAQAYAGRDYEGARKAYAGVGDVEGVASVDDAQNATTKRVADEAQFMLGLYRSGGPEAVLSAFDQRSAGYGASPEQLASIRAQIEANPEQALTALAGAPSYQYVRGENGEIVSVNKATGEVDVIREGTPDAPSVPAGYRMRPDGNLEFIPGGPADPRQAGTLAGVKRAPPRPRAARGGSSVNLNAMSDQQLLDLLKVAK